MEIVRYVNGVSVSEKELSAVKAVTPEMTAAVNEARRRAKGGVEGSEDGVKNDVG